MGVRTVILLGVTIGERAVVAYGAIGTKDLPAETIIGGISACKIKTINE